MLTILLKPWAELTAADLAGGGLVTVRADSSVRDAARRLSQTGVTGAPVVDDAGRLVGVFSLVDALRSLTRDPAAVPAVRACQYQDALRGRDGREVVVCTLADGRCLLQRQGGPVAGRPATVCAAPYGVAADWQMVHLDVLPADDVRHHMTADPLTVSPDTPTQEVARRLAEAGVHRLVVVDDTGRPAGVVSSQDVVAAVAFAPAADDTPPPRSPNPDPRGP